MHCRVYSRAGQAGPTQISHSVSRRHILRSMEGTEDCCGTASTGPRLPKPRRTAASLHEGLRDAYYAGSLDGHHAPRPDPSDACKEQSCPAHSNTIWQSRRKQCHAVSYKGYFDSCIDVKLESRNGTFRVYSAGHEGPVVLCMHGAGYTALTWALVAAQLKDKCRVVAFDQRGHGSTATNDDLDLSATSLTKDAAAVWDQLFKSESPATVLIGHSMGGAIAVRTANQGLIPKVEGVIVVDVVEGTALAALPAMMGILTQRPVEFSGLDAAFEWALANGMTRNPEAASVSLPSQLTAPSAETPNLRWVTPLKQSKPYWHDWYTGLSKAFLAIPCPKILLLAGTDRLDKDLTIGQMQGKFQLALLPVAGHAIQEDEPGKTADIILAFLRRFRIGASNRVVLPHGAWGTRC